MARKFLTSLDLTKNELQNAVVQNLPSAPSSPLDGQIYYDSSTDILYYFNGNGWINAGGISVGTFGGRPAAAASNSGTFFYATDRNLVYYSSGTAWTQVDNFGATVVSETSYGQSSAIGTSYEYARADHTHGTPPLTNLTPQAITATSGSVGSGTAPAREDHVHNFTPGNFPVSTFGVPTSNTSWNSYKITNLADPTSAQDAATKNYVDGVAQGLNIHDQVDIASTTNIVGTYNDGTADASGGLGIGAYFAVTATGPLVIDGHTVVVNERVLLKNQTDAKQNGIYVVTTAGAVGVSAVLTRSTDANNRVPGQVSAGDFVFVTGGSTLASTGWTQVAEGTATTPLGAIKLGVDNISFTQFSGTGTYTASAGVLLTGTNFTFNPLSTGGLQTDSTHASIKLPTDSGLGTTSSGLAVGAGDGITVSGGLVSVTAGYTARKYATAIGNGVATTYTVTHSLNTRDVTVTIYDATTYAEVSADIIHATTTTVTVTFALAPASNAYRVVVVG